MKRSWSVVAGLCLFAVSVALAAAPEPQVACYRKGDVGVFRATVPLPPAIDPATHIFWARADVGTLYLIYVRSPRDAALAARAHDDHGPIKLPPEKQAQVDALSEQRAALSTQWQKNQKARRKTRQHLNGLKRVLKEEQARKENRDEAIIARTRKLIESLEAELKRLEAEQKDGDHWTRIRKIDERIAALRKAAGQQIAMAAAAGPLQVLGRFQGAGKARLVVLARRVDELLAEPRLVAHVDLDLPAADGGDEALLATWAELQDGYFMGYALTSPFSSYYQYALLRSARARGQRDIALLRPTRDRRPDLYSVATGATAIQESLQLDAMTGREKLPADRSVEIATLEGPTIKSHPFEKMLKGRTPVVSPVASLVPFDSYYCHFASISKQIATSDLIEQWGTSLLRMLSVSARDSDLPSKYQTQLCIGVSMLTRLFGDLVIGEVAFTGSDPFLKGGSDLTAIILVKNRPVFDKQMQAYIDTALQTHRDAKLSSTDYQGVAIRSVVTPDRRVCSHSCTLGDYKVYSNSLDALKRVIDTHAKRRRSLADEPDFRYMRTIFPARPQEEDGFLYLSDAFIRKLVGPRWKIEAQRRIICQNHLRMITNAATLYRAELRTRPTLAALLEREYLPEAATTCPDGGSHRLDATGRALCSVHNCLRYCTPVDSIALTKVAKQEAADYKQFVRNYNRYWSQFFDPIGIRFTVGDRVQVETCILPLIESSIYNQVRALVGGEPVPLRARVVTPRTILAVTIKLDLARPDYKRMVDGMQRALFPTLPPVTQVVGSSMSIGLCDSDVLFTFDERGMNMFGDWMDLEGQLVLATILSAINLPAYAVIDLRDETLARGMVRDLLAAAETKARIEGRQPWDNWFGIERYAAGEHKGHAIGTVSIRLALIKFRLSYAIAHKRLLIATKRYVLEELLDTLEAGARAPAPTANVHVDIRPRAYDKLLPVTQAGWQERMRHACLKNLVPLWALVQHHGATEATLGAVSRRVDGVTPRCPCGGVYKHDTLREIVYCSVHGSSHHPRQPARTTGKEPLVRFLRRLRDGSVTLRFTPEGIMTRLTLQLDPEPPQGENRERN